MLAWQAASPKERGGGQPFPFSFRAPRFFAFPARGASLVAVTHRAALKHWLVTANNAAVA